MTDTPDMITREGDNALVAGRQEFLYECVQNGFKYITASEPSGMEESTAQYVRFDVAESMAQARVTAALREAAEFLHQQSETYPDNVAWCVEDDAKSILDLIPDAGSAFDRAIAEALTKAADAVKVPRFCGEKDWPRVSALHEARKAILALIPEAGGARTKGKE